MFPHTYSAENAAFQALVKLVTRLRDVRCIAVLEKAAPPELLKEELARVLAALRKIDWEDADPPRVSRIEDALAQLPAPTEAAVLATGAKAPERNESELLKLILQTPTSDGPRLIYADFLAERGDPLGEFIALQCRKSPSAAEQKRMRALQREHGRLWLGEIEPAVERAGRVFARGFLSQAWVRFKTPTQQRRLVAHPLWNTLEVLHPGPVRVDDFLVECSLAGLRTVGWALDAELVARMARRRAPYPQLEELTLRIGEVEDEVLNAIGTAGAFVRVTRIELAGKSGRLVNFEWLFASPLGRQMTTLQVYDGPRNLRDWLTRLAALQGLKVYVVGISRVGDWIFAKGLGDGPTQ